MKQIYEIFKNAGSKLGHFLKEVYHVLLCDSPKAICVKLSVQNIQLGLPISAKFLEENVKITFWEIFFECFDHEKLSGIFGQIA